MKVIPYPDECDISSMSFDPKFQFSKGFARELSAKFPTWEALHNALNRNDQTLNYEIPKIGNFRYNVNNWTRAISHSPIANMKPSLQLYNNLKRKWFNSEIIRK